MKIIHILSLSLCLFANSGLANNITFASQDFGAQNTNSHTRIVQFDISWENSWRDDENYDAVWVFLKYSTDGGITWHHGTLTTPAGYGSGTGLDIIVPSDKKGAYLRRTLAGEGTVDTDGIQLVWDYGTDLGADAAGDQLAIFAIVRLMATEMVYVPQGPFYMSDRYNNTSSGSPGTSQIIRDSAKAQQTTANGGLDNEFPVGGFISAWGTQLHVRNYGVHALNIKMTEGATAGYDQWFDDTWGRNSSVLGLIAYFNNQTATNGSAMPGGCPGIWFHGDEGISIDQPTESNMNTNWPTGFKAFYLARYEVSQAQYRDFLNSLSPAQAVNRFPGYNSGLRFGIQSDNGLYGCDLNNNGIFDESADGECVTASYCSHNDSLAINDWTSTRLMTEFEFEKAGRGTNLPATYERANGVATSSGGAVDVYPSAVSLSGMADEVPSNNADDGANIFYNIPSIGPFRSGSLATSTSDRRKSGAGYYGNMDLTGNIEEDTITVGTIRGRSYSAAHGDGELDPTGYHNVTGWPGGTNSACLANYPTQIDLTERSMCLRGGEYKWTPSSYYGSLYIPLSGRYLSTDVFSYDMRSGTYNQSGLRGARTAE